MSNQEAVSHLKTWRITGDRSHEALDMAISALQAQDSPKPTAGSVQNVQNEDLISRKAAIELIHSLYPSAPIMRRNRERWEEKYKPYIEVEKALERLPSAQPESQWIPVSERLPEEETEVLVTRTFLGCKDGSHGWNNHIPPRIYVEVAQYFDGEWTALSDEYKVARSKHTDPIAWMPLPKPYRAERRTDETD